jgi:hypothetical protein
MTHIASQAGLSKTDEANWQLAISTAGLEAEQSGKSGTDSPTEVESSNDSGQNSAKPAPVEPDPALDLTADSPATAQRKSHSPGSADIPASISRRADKIERATTALPEACKTPGEKKSPSHFGSFKRKGKSDSGDNVRIAAGPILILPNPRENAAFTAFSLPLANLETPTTTSTPVQRALTLSGDALIPSSDGPAPLAVPDAPFQADEATTSQSIAGGRAVLSADHDTLQELPASTPSLSSRTQVQQDSFQNTPACEDLREHTLTTAPRPTTAGATTANEANQLLLDDRNRNQPGVSVSSSNQHASIENAQRQFHKAVGTIAPAEKSHANAERFNSHPSQQSGLQESPMPLSEIGIRAERPVGSHSVSPSSTSAAFKNPLEAMDAMDASLERSAPVWLHAGAREVEAGFRDPTLGWVGVRAHVDASGVHAALVPGSSEAAQSLGIHLAGLNAYLADHHAQLNKVTVAQPDTAWNDTQMQQEMDRRQGKGADDGAGRERERETQPDIRSRSSAGSPVPDVLRTHAQMARSGSNHISLIA